MQQTQLTLRPATKAQDEASCRANAQTRHECEMHIRQARAIYAVCYGSPSAGAAQHKHSDGVQMDTAGAFSHALRTAVIQRTDAYICAYMCMCVRICAACTCLQLGLTFPVATAPEDTTVWKLFCVIGGGGVILCLSRCRGLVRFGSLSDVQFPLRCHPVAGPVCPKSAGVRPGFRRDNEGTGEPLHLQSASAGVETERKRGGGAGRRGGVCWDKDAARHCASLSSFLDRFLSLTPSLSLPRSDR